MNAPQPQKTNGLAIAALVTGILCVPLVPIILGAIALSQIGKSGGAQKGKGLAIAGLVLGGAIVPLMGVLSAIAIPNFVRYQLRSKESEARMELRQLATSAEAAAAARGAYPEADTGWVPSTPCGTAGCMPDPARFAGEPWATFDFDPGGVSKHYFQYRYTSDGTRYTVQARGDLDGDGEYSQWILEGGQGAPPSPKPVKSTPGVF